ncbi:hypothetical protein C8Q72DRAFT_891447 [Fomitopsis betulina]|nr:hypothetical protein C8Q72DRAFT_891447 [Fomitopsis betulina]
MTARQNASLACSAVLIGSSRVRAGVGRKGTAAPEGYVNLADAAGVSTARDTSSYYHGPSRGKRHFGYVDDDEF